MQGERTTLLRSVLQLSSLVTRQVNLFITPIFSKEIPWWLEKINLQKGLGYSNSEVIGGLPRFIRGVQRQN